MKRVWRILLIFAACYAAAPAMAALQASVDRNPVSLNESFTLTLESSDDQDGEPDLSALQSDFEILNQGKSSSFQFINGQTNHNTKWSIMLMPKHSGQVRIPSITVGNEQSAPIALTVTADTAQGTSPQEDIFLEVSASPQNVYIQQQVVYTVRLLHKVNIGNNATLGEPKLAGDDAIVEKLGDDKSYQIIRNGVQYGVYERNYAIYPQHAGQLAIPPLMFNGDIVQSGRRNFFDPFRANTRRQRTVSDPVTISIKAIPAAFHGKTWLPATSLQLVEHWSPDPPEFIVGQPVTRTVAVMADGLTAAQLPPLDTGAIDGLKQYPDQPSLKDTKSDSGMTGIRSEKIALIPKQPGTLTLPAITLPWWNTATNTLEMASLPGRTITVVAAPGTPSGTAPAVPDTAAAPSQEAPVSPSVATEETGTVQAETTAPPSGLWPWLTLVMGLGWLATALAWFWRSRRKVTATPVTSNVNGSLPELEKQIKASCLANDATGCSRAILNWAKQRWPDHSPVSLTALAQRCHSPLSGQLLALDRVLYAHSPTPWEGAELWQAFSRNKPKEKRHSSTPDTALRPLYEA